MPQKPPPDAPIDFADPDPPEPARPRPARGAAPPPTAVPAPPPLMERACPRCGFRTSAKPAPTRCPRCSGLMDANFPDLLQYSLPAWVLKLATGAFLMAWVPVIHILAAVLGRAINRFAGSLVHVGAELLLFITVWLVTAPEPGARTPRDSTAPWARLLALASLIAWTAAWLSRFGEDIGTAYWVSLYTCLTLSATETAVLGIFLRTLAVRIPDDSSAMAFQNFAWVIPAMCLFFIVDKLLVLEQWIAGGFFISFPLIGVLCFLFMWVSRYLIRLGVDLKEAVTLGHDLTTARGPRESTIKPQVTVFPTSRK